MTRVKERSKLRQQIRKDKKALETRFDAFLDSTYVDPNGALLLIDSITSLSSLQRKLNAISVKADEKKILLRAAKRVDGNG
jgi:hypothetical protein